MISQPLRTSSVVSSKITRLTSAPSATSLRTCSSYRSPLPIAPAKIVGFVVTPTTCLSLISSARLPVSIRSRERSSSQMETPASESVWSRSVMVPPGRGWVEGQLEAAMLSRAALATAVAVTPNSV